MGFGDEIVAAGQAQRIFDADPSKRVAICGADGAVRWSPIWAGNPAIAHPDDVAAGEAVHRLMSGPNCRPYIVYPFSASSGWTFNKAFRCRDHVAKLYLTDVELAYGQQIREALRRPFVAVDVWSKHVNLRWPTDRWLDLFDALPDVLFVQQLYDGVPVLKARNVVQAPTPSFRQACGLVASAAVYVRGESGMCHAAAALGIPQVTIFGGCMDPDVMAYYPLQFVINDGGPGSPCGSWHPCQHCADSMAGITVDHVAEALRDRLTLAEAA